MQNVIELTGAPNNVTRGS